MAQLRNARKHVPRLYIFLIFTERPQKSFRSKFQGCCPNIMYEQVKKNFSYFTQCED